MPQLSDPTAAGIASGYRYRLLWPETFHAPYPTRMAPAGFLISSAGDMSHYLVAQLNGGTYEHSQVLSHQGIDMLHAPVARMSSSSSHGMGWAIEGASGSMRIWHDREVSNFHSHLSLFPDRQLGIVVLINVGAFGNSAAINNLVEGIIARLLGRGHTAAAESPSIALSRLTTLVPLLVVTLWAAWSYRSLRGWRLYPALVIDVSVIGLMWISCRPGFRRRWPRLPCSHPMNSPSSSR